MRIQTSTRQLVLKIVYYGPGMSGKTTNLEQLHHTSPGNARGALVQLDTESERTLFFDYFPMALGSIGGYALKVDFFTVPGQSFYQATRRAVLENVDGIVFVADSAPSREDANQVSREDLRQLLEDSGRSLDTIPHVYQWNKRDCKKPLPIERLEAQLNPERAPSVLAIAIQGVGVRETQNHVLRAVLDMLRGQSERSLRHA